MIQNLLFDLGGVIMDIRKDNCVLALRELGFHNPDEYLGDYSQKGPFGQLEQGLITPDEFRGFVRSQIDGPVTDMQIDDAFNEFLIGIPVERLRLLQQLRHTYGIYLLSNTNAIMWNARIAEEFRKDGLDIDAYFDGIVTSFEAKLLKPDVKIFDYAAAHCDIKPEETLFLDDSLANLGAAEKAGFRTAHVPEGVEYSKVLADLNLL
ncbi:MAG: HAD family phosphatase [Muribaculaceae bacterium]|nr:HAD family phosphatase [Muribaculaceae bacterium]